MKTKLYKLLSYFTILNDTLLFSELDEYLEASFEVS